MWKRILGYMDLGQKVDDEWKKSSISHEEFWDLQASN